LTAKTTSVRSPRDYRSIFDDVAERLRGAPWFADGWSAVVGEHESATWLTVSKPLWRTSGLEIHFESWIKKEQIAKRRVPVAMHVEGGYHARRSTFNARFHLEVANLVQSWEGYIANESGMTRLTTSLPLETDRLTSALEAEYTRLALLGPIMDHIADTLHR
jgi:hypothetical protein